MEKGESKNKNKKHLSINIIFNSIVNNRQIGIIY